MNSNPLFDISHWFAHGKWILPTLPSGYSRQWQHRHYSTEAEFLALPAKNMRVETHR